MRVCVCRSQVPSHRGLHFPANRFNFTFSIELEFSFTLFPLYISLSISQFLFVCVRRVFRSLFRLHIHGNGTNTRKLRHIHNRRRINWEEARTLQFICIYFIYFHLLYNFRIIFTHSTFLSYSYSFFALFASSSASSAYFTRTNR